MANRSTFPEQVDSFVELYDLPPNLVSQAKRYQELKMKPTLTSTEQNELNGLTTQLKDFIISPEVWNKFADALVNTQTFFTQEVAGYIEAKQAVWDTYVKSFKYVEVYNSAHAYKFQNMVKNSNGDLYLAIKDVPAGTSLTNTSYWQKISTKGDKGDVGLNAYYKGDYSDTATYAIGDAVSYGGYLYYCKAATTAGTAPPNGSYWFLWDRHIVSKTEPPTRQAGLVWIKLQD
ncbi:hypothetical protein MOE90_20600 [Bacillus spizizenii]|nr:hypothetical protein [Bacillus spizizenii]MCY9124902.1 hypothetical protein [Bacillus spizizenii]